MFGRSSDSTGSTDSVESIPPPYASPIILPSTRITAPRTGSTSPTKRMVQFQLDHKGERDSSEASGPSSDASPVTSPTTPPSSEISATRARFTNFVRSAVMVNRLVGIGDEARMRVSSFLTDGKAINRKPMAVTMPRSSQVAGLVPRLQNMAPTQDIAAHTALVRCMQVSINQVLTFAPAINHVPQFSPDGKFLATSSWDHTSVIFHVGVRPADVSLRCITEPFVRSHSLPIVCCRIPPDSLVKSHGKNKNSSIGK